MDSWAEKEEITNMWIQGQKSWDWVVLDGEATALPHELKVFIYIVERGGQAMASS